MGFRGLDSSTILNSRGEIPRTIRDFPESLSQAMLVGTMLVGRLGVQDQRGDYGAIPLWFHAARPCADEAVVL